MNNKNQMLVCARHSSKTLCKKWAHSTLITSLWNRHYYYSFYRQKNWGIVRFRCLPLVSGEARIQTESLTPRIHALICLLPVYKVQYVLGKSPMRAKAGAVVFNWGQTSHIGEQKLVCLLTFFFFPEELENIVLVLFPEKPMTPNR